MKTRPKSANCRPNAVSVSGDDRHLRGRCFGRIVGRADDAAVVLEDGDDLASLINMVAQRDAVDARRDQLLKDLRRSTEPARDVLGVGHDR